MKFVLTDCKLQELYELGARRIGVLSAPPIGCVPSQRTLAGGLERECAGDHNYAAKLFNSKLSRTLDSLGELPDSKIVYIDVYNPLLDIIVNYQSYGKSISIHFSNDFCRIIQLIIELVGLYFRL